MEEVLINKHLQYDEDFDETGQQNGGDGATGVPSRDDSYQGSHAQDKQNSPERRLEYLKDQIQYRAETATREEDDFSNDDHRVSTGEARD